MRDSAREDVELSYSGRFAAGDLLDSREHIPYLAVMHVLMSCRQGHFNGQYVDGLRAPVVILPTENRTDGLEWDEDYTLIVSDWYHEEHPKLMREDFLVWVSRTLLHPVLTHTY